MIVKTVCITGGTGSFGSALARRLWHDVNWKQRILSRDEAKQEVMAHDIPPGQRMTYVIGDIRDWRKCLAAFDGADVVVHAAALKRVPQGERHGDEFVRTNIIGSQNVIYGALGCNVPKTLLISSDKAVAPINLYGKTKAVAESLFVQASGLGAVRGCGFAAVRGGNVWGSRGSVVEIWQQRRLNGEPLLMSDPDTTRFHLPMDEWLTFCLRVIEEMRGGEIFIPKCRAWRLGDLASAFSPPKGLITPVTVTGLRAGDKRHEVLVSSEEAPRTVDIGWAYVIQPPEELRGVMKYDSWDGPVLDGAFASDGAERMPVEELEALVNG